MKSTPATTRINVVVSISIPSSKLSRSGSLAGSNQVTTSLGVIPQFVSILEPGSSRRNSFLYTATTICTLRVNSPANGDAERERPAR